MMLNTFTVCFFGHREIECTDMLEHNLDILLHNLIITKEYVEFLIGRNGEFDLLASSAIKRAIRRYSCGNTSLTLILPYINADYRDNEQSYLDYYDNIEICEESAEAHFKSAIQVRNRSMIDRSDLGIFYATHKGGAFHAMQYALKQNKPIINLADSVQISPSVLNP